MGCEAGGHSAAREHMHFEHAGTHLFLLDSLLQLADGLRVEHELFGWHVRLCRNFRCD